MRQPVWTFLTVMLGVLVALGPALGFGQAPSKAIQRHHPWGSFAPGAWKIVRVVTETLGERGVVEATSTTETRTTLDELDQKGVTLFTEAIVEVAGKRLEAEPRCVQQDFRGEVASAQAKVKDLGAASLSIDGRKIACQVEEVEVVGSANKTTTKIHFSEEFPPYVLKRESVTTDKDGKTKLNETTVSVVAFDLPWKVLAEIKSTALVHVVHKHPKGSTDTWAVTSPDVPGGVIHHASKEFDQNGRLVRRSTLELVDYGRELDDEGTGLFRRLRKGRSRKSHR